MKRELGLTLMGVLILAVVAMAIATFSREASARSLPPHDVVMVRCDTASATFNTLAYIGSTAAPSKKSDSCPENLSLLMKDGFEVRDVGHSDIDSDFVVFTLVR